MTTREAATRLGLSTSTVREQFRSGVLRGVRRGRLLEFSVAEVKRYEREHKGRVGRHIPGPETRAKMSAAKAGWRPSAEMAAARRGKPLSPAHRDAVRNALTGKPFKSDHLDALRAYHRKRRGTHLPAATRAKLAEAMVRAHREGRRPYSPLENRAAELLVPMGYERSVLLDGHAFDFGSPDGLMLIEVNGCRWHDHRAIKPECPTHMSRSTNSRDEERRDIARANGRILVEMWECEEARWPDVIALLRS